jgi:hypothetical protein
MDLAGSRDPTIGLTIAVGKARSPRIGDRVAVSLIAHIQIVFFIAHMQFADGMAHIETVDRNPNY